MKPRRCVQIALALLLLVSIPTAARADTSAWGWAPGVKLGYTFGQGWTFGIEVSFIRVPDLGIEKGESLFSAASGAIGRLISRTWGIVVNMDTTFRGLFRTRVGVEWVGPFLGLEAGPVLVYDKKHGTHLGLGITPWLGYHLYPYYTFTWVFGRAPNQHEIGSYLKAPLLSFGGDSSYDDDWDD